MLFFDEQNGLYEIKVGTQDAIETSPFNLANFTFTYVGLPIEVIDFVYNSTALFLRYINLR